MDEKDERILDVLKENSKLSTQQISKKTFIPITTVHHRIKKLEKDGVIKKYTVVLDNKKIDKAISAYVLINVDYKLLKQIKKTQYELAKKLKLNPAIEEVSVITGETDTIIKVWVKDIDELNKLIEGYLRNLDGVDRTRTLVVLSEV
jgi:DNA-binding Lrp family transcriptional regulator|tara:strand:+ start:27889 stop:28329 length:441 start_codon:yes stop_codon:yes gene_type:complete